MAMLEPEKEEAKGEEVKKSKAKILLAQVRARDTSAMRMMRQMGHTPRFSLGRGHDRVSS